MGIRLPQPLTPRVTAMATPGGGSLRVYDRDLLDQVLGSPKVRAGVAKPPRRARRSIRDSSYDSGNPGTPRRVSPLGPLD